MTGTHILTVEAVDLAGNVAAKGSFMLDVEGTIQYKIYLPLTVRP